MTGNEWARMTRRDFVGLGIASLVASRSALPAAAAAPRGTLRLGLVGAGTRGAAWVPRLAAPGVAWRAVAEPDDRRLRAVLHRCAEGGAFPVACGDAEIVADPGVDAVVVAAPAARAVAVATAACAAGKDVLWDGPLPGDRGAIERLVRAAAERGSLVQCFTPALGDAEHLRLVDLATREGAPRVRLEIMDPGPDASLLSPSLLDELSVAVAMMRGAEPREMHVARGAGWDPATKRVIARTGVWCDFDDGARIEVALSHLHEGALRVASLALQTPGSSRLVARRGMDADPNADAHAAALLGDNFVRAARSRQPQALLSPLSVNLSAQVIRWNANEALASL
jgi:hypothetical protein